MKVVVDTNVIVSAMLTKGGLCHRLVKQVLEHEHWHISPEVFDEYKEVLTRSEMGFATQDVLDLLDQILMCALQVQPQSASIKTTDSDDQMFLDLALAVMADVLVTGNKKDFPSRASLPFQILSPAEYFQKIQKV